MQIPPSRQGVAGAAPAPGLHQPPGPRDRLQFPRQSKALQESEKWPVWSNDTKASQGL